MDLRLELDDEEVEYCMEQGILDHLSDSLSQALKSVASSRPSDPFLTLVDLLKNVGCQNKILVQGYPVNCVDGVELGVGPIVGEVTENSAIIMIEVKNSKSASNLVTCDVYRKGERTVYCNVEKSCPFTTPTAFLIQDLEANTEYTVVFNGLDDCCAKNAYALFKTKQPYKNMKTFKIIALSCDRPDRMLLGQKNPWYELAKKSYTADVMLHLGDQVYNKGEDNDKTLQIFDSTYDGLGDREKGKMKKRARALLRKKYRDTWNKKMTKDTLQRGSHLMIWSDNDVANDFTTLKTQDGLQAYPPAFLQCGIEVYRQYQRILWDPEAIGTLPSDPEEYFSEFHSHVYGPIGIFLMDMRGNRITADGVQQSENELVSAAQWEAVEEFFRNPQLKVIIIGSEIPFVGDDPISIKEKAEKVDFLKDHWPYNDEDLVRLLDLAFTWKSQEEDDREVVFLGGDIHCGVTSVIRDEETDLTITHLTTSPITNHVCKFFPDLSGRINDRYSYDHMPLGENQRNYAEINITLQPSLSVTSQLRPVSTNMYKVMEWMSDEEE
ncbi:uncharacterized protein LOC111694908 [Eurytemora carolleeae]|uniref:uncharacterized protein LOC111694908 n=1 Tax=Eurytemora carolleeae TaxID=1294199 RepID=UPI000C769C49|nr:uncharacterized protein LOC111694908 [Eurytemora carolleeae]|eukprot:XP_023319733.1 uncharacterized protein LOC111694908 [Eurytemora affinis]